MGVSDIKYIVEINWVHWVHICSDCKHEHTKYCKINEKHTTSKHLQYVED
jgi:hypothetical protein